METPFWRCFECDHEQKESSPCGCCPECEECGGPCEEVGGSDEFAGGERKRPLSKGGEQ